MRASILLLLVACSGPTPTDTTGSAGTPEAPVDPDVHSYTPDTFPPSDPQRVVFFGDSITAGYGVEDDDVYTALLQQNKDRKWPDQVGDDLSARFPNLGEVLDVSV